MPQFFMKGAQKGKKRKPITKPSVVRDLLNLKSLL